MSLSIREIQSRADMRRFVLLPREIHAHHKGWVPPIYSDDRKTFSPRYNPAHKYCSSIYALAYDGGTAVGRIAGIINHRYNRFRNVKHARFGYLESPEREDVTRLLLEHVEAWGRTNGMEKIVGPMGFTEEDPEGFRVEGFEVPPNLATYDNFPSLPESLAQFGYSKEVDYVVYQVPLATAMTDSYRRLYERVRARTDFVVVEFTHRRAIVPYIRPIFRLMNECFVPIYGYSLLDEVEMDRLGRRYLPVVDPRFIKVVVNAQKELIGFIIGIPSIAEGVRNAHGRILPFGFLKILNARGRSKKLDLYLGAIKEPYRGRGVDLLIGYSMMKSALGAGFETMDSHHELETNTRIRAEMERVGGRVYKRYRLFQKSLV
jgi:hypothetical protein